MWSNAFGHQNIIGCPIWFGTIENGQTKQPVFYSLNFSSLHTVWWNTKCVHNPGQGTIPTHHEDPSIRGQSTTSSVYKEAEDHLCGEKSERCGSFVLFHAQAHKRLAVLSWLGLIFPGLYKRGRYVKIFSLSFYSKQGSRKERKQLPSSILTDPLTNLH